MRPGRGPPSIHLPEILRALLGGTSDAVKARVGVLAMDGDAAPLQHAAPPPLSCCVSGLAALAGAATAALQAAQTMPACRGGAAHQACEAKSQRALRQRVHSCRCRLDGAR